ncbi:MAG: S41 family peptidase [Gemmataceae bacterium]
MRQGRWLVFVLVLAPPAVASPVPPGPPPVKDRKALREEANRFAHQLSHFSEQVSLNYYRPVNREDLLEGALYGLYQAARKPPPRDLKAQVRQAVSLSSTMRAQALQQQAMTVSERRPLEPVEKLLVRLREELGDAPALDGRPAVLVAVKAMTRLLDPHSGVVSLEEQRRSIGLDHEALGVGVQFKEAQAPGSLEVETVHPGGPAQRAGLRPGDVITRLDGQPAAKASPAKVMALRGTRVYDDLPDLAVPAASATKPAEPPQLIQVHFRRPGEAEERTATLLRERFRPETVQGVRRRDDNSWEWLPDEREPLAHVRVTHLSRGTGEDLRQVVFALRQRKVKGIVLDLRWCPGGYLNEAVEVADLFLGTCVIATIKNRGREDTVYRSTEEAKPGRFPLVVLVNGETSGGAELVAAALQDHKRAVVAGQRTLGKASVQTPLALGLDGIGFKLTSGTFVRPGGKNLHRFPESGPGDDWGVIPDEDARLSPDLGKRLKGWWQATALRPPRSAERLPLDDPRADPQQQLALQALRKLVK